MYLTFFNYIVFEILTFPNSFNKCVILYTTNKICSFIYLTYKMCFYSKLVLFFKLMIHIDEKMLRCWLQEKRTHI